MLRTFVHELIEWAISSNVAVLGVVTGCDDMLRHDSNMTRLDTGKFDDVTG